MEIPKLINFAPEEKKSVKEERKNNIVKKNVLNQKLAVKFTPKSKYKYVNAVVSDRTIYFYNKKNELDYENKYFLPYSNLDYFEDHKAKAHILKLTKTGEQGILLAFKTKAKA